MAVGSAMILLICALWFVVRGAAHDLYETLFVFTPHYTKLGWEDATVPGMFYLAVEEWFVDLSSANAVGVLAAFMLRSHRDTRARGHACISCSVVAIQLAGVTMQGKFFPYHYGASLLLGASWRGSAPTSCGSARSPRAGSASPLSRPWCPSSFFARSATRNTQTDFLDRCVARQRAAPRPLRTRRATSSTASSTRWPTSPTAPTAASPSSCATRLAPDETAFIWGFEPMIYDMAERRPATRFIYDVPQRVAWFRDEARAHADGRSRSASAQGHRGRAPRCVPRGHRRRHRQRRHAAEISRARVTSARAVRARDDDRRLRRLLAR